MFRKLILTTLIFMMGMGAIELASRLVESSIAGSNHTPPAMGWQAEFFGGLLDWHEPDPDLLWRFKANLDGSLINTNSEHYLGPLVDPVKRADRFRILLLGDSSPVGLGLASRNQAFGEVLRYMIGVTTGGRKEIELINAAVSGYSSEQIVAYLSRYGLAYDPDLVILYCGNNDASVSGNMSDQELLDSQRLGGVRRLAAHLALYRVIRGLVQSSPRDNPSARDLVVRVTPDRFGQNLSRMAALCREAGVSLVIVKPPVPLLWPAGLQFKPFLGKFDDQGSTLFPPALADLLGREIEYCLDRAMFDSLYGKADIFTSKVYASAHVSNQTPSEMIKHYYSLSESEQLDPLALNNLGVALWRSGRFDEADSVMAEARRAYFVGQGDPLPVAVKAAGSPLLFNLGIVKLTVGENWIETLTDQNTQAWVYLDSALQADYFSLRIKNLYLNEIDSLIGQTGLYIVNPASQFAQNGGERLFIDHCHPTAEGHRIIAQLLTELIAVEDLMP